jgi:hypothetical protein
MREAKANGGNHGTKNKGRLNLGGLLLILHTSRLGNGTEAGGAQPGARFFISPFKGGDSAARTRDLRVGSGYRACRKGAV